MKKLIRFLEIIPNWLSLPISGGKSLPVPVDAFSYRDTALYTSTLILWFGTGVVALYRHSWLVSLIYLVLGVTSYTLYVYLTCPKCPYYKKRCYIFGGQFAGRCFANRPGDYTPFEDVIVPLLWIITSVFPVLFLVWYRAWESLLLYLALVIIWQIMHKRTICVRCLNIRCALNPRYTGRNVSQ